MDRKKIILSEANLGIYYESLHTTENQPELNEVFETIHGLVDLVKEAYEALNFIQNKAPGYDWNADPLSLTLKIGDFNAKAEKLWQ